MRIRRYTGTRYRNILKLKLEIQKKYRLQCAPRSASKAFFGLSSFLVVNRAKTVSVTQKSRNPENLISFFWVKLICRTIY